MSKRVRYRDDREFFDMAKRIIRTAGRRAAQGDPAEQLRELVELQKTLNKAIVVAIRGMRDQGATWEAIGAVTGTTRQAALMRWTPKLEELEALEP